MAKVEMVLGAKWGQLRPVVSRSPVDWTHAPPSVRGLLRLPVILDATEGNQPTPTIINLSGTSEGSDIRGTTKQTDGTEWQKTRG